MGTSVDEAVTMATTEPAVLLECVGQPVVVFYVTAIMSEADADHASQMREEFLRRATDALVADGLGSVDAERFARKLGDRVGAAWSLLHAAAEGST